MLTVAIHRDPKAPTPYSARWAEFLEAAQVDVRWVNLRLPDALEQVRGCAGVMWHWEFMPHERQVAYRILHTIEEYLEIPVFPNHRTAWHYDDKITQYYIFQALDIPTPTTWIFWDHEPAREWAEGTSYPKVFKLATGASSFAVRIVRSRTETLKLIDMMFGPGTYPDTIHQDAADTGILPKNIEQFRERLHRWKQILRWAIKDKLPDLPPRFWWQPEKDYVYFQEFIPENAFDTRITVIGKRAFGFRRNNRPGDFRASGSGQLDYDSPINLDCVRLAHEISAKLQVQSMAYDFLVKPGGQPVVCEMSYTFLDWAVEKCAGYWTPDLQWVPGHTWPEAAQVEDFLKRIIE
jgi:hypothetical protein